MQHFLIGQGEGMDNIFIIKSENAEKALNFYKHHIQPDNDFLEYLHDWSINGGFSCAFYYDEESDGQKELPQKEVNKRIQKYFKEKPEFEKIYLKHWNEEIKADNENFQMSTFPDDMIEWVWRKTLFEKNSWTSFKIINLDNIEVIG